jgi:hypothetical protein
MRSRNGERSNLWFLFLWANVFNILFLAFRSAGFAINRPFIVYDYFLVVICVALRFPTGLTFFIFTFIASLDIINTISGNFLFNLTDFGRNIEFFFLYSFSSGHYISAFFTLILVTVIYLFFKKFISGHNYSIRLTVGIIAAMVLATYFFDALNGRTLLFKQKVIAISHYNLGGSSFVDLGIALNAYRQEIKQPSALSPSVSFRTFSDDSTSNQLLILVESWGLPLNPNHVDELNTLLQKKSEGNRWTFSSGSTTFRGSTFHAELRELLNVYGDYRFFLNKDSAQAFTSIFKIKKRQGYSTSAIHSFSHRMFQRNIWWKNIGIDTSFFMEDVVKAKNIQIKDLNSDTPFLSINDEEALAFLAAIPKETQRFDYFLSENSHLPFFQSYESAFKFSFGNELSKESAAQLSRILELLVFVIEDPVTKRWEKILVVGDHMPPFSRTSDRNFYSFDRVPYFILDKR